MPPQIATVVFALDILVLFLLDRDRKLRVFSALWLSTAWVPIGASRPGHPAGFNLTTVNLFATAREVVR